MIFNIPQLNRILNALLLNNSEARHYFFTFINSLPEEVIDIVRECRNIEYAGKNYQISAHFDYNNIKMLIYYNNSSLYLEMCPISKKQLKEIPLDQKHEIFFDGADYGLDSPAFFNIAYNPDVDFYSDYEAEDYCYFIVKQKNKAGEIEYHLISQSLHDAGVHNTKVDIEDFIIEPPKKSFLLSKKELNAGKTNRANLT